MQYDILHDIPGRLRVHCRDVAVNPKNAAAISELLSLQDGVILASLSARTGNLLVVYSRVMPRRHVLSLLDVLEPSDWDGFGASYEDAPPPLFETAFSAIFQAAVSTALKMLLLPLPVRWSLVALEALPWVGKGIASLLGGRLDIAVMDATAISVLAARRDFTAIRTILWMFEAADALEGWTRENSRRSLADALTLRIDSVWMRLETGDAQRPLADVRPGDLVIVRTGNVVPIDGVVQEGEALVNQSVLTGESEAARKSPGLSVFAGTVVDEGMLVVRVTKAADETRLQGVVRFIEESESLKAGVQSRAERMADAIVPYSLLTALAVLAATGSPVRASALLMVDYSCAIRMATPLTILGGIREGIRRGVLIKGGKHMEALAAADTLIIDKTGTLTMSKPSVARVIGFDGWEAVEVLRTAACIEEHFPHPVGRAVVKKAESENLRHRERHAKPEYILAHGIASRLEGKRVMVGSAHYIFDDAGVAWTDEARAETDAEARLGRSLLYLAFDGRLVGMLAMEDPIRDDAAGTLSALRNMNVERMEMLTGDAERTANAVAKRLGLDGHRSGLLPVDKAAYINRLKKNGRTVMFVGDGVNDSPALSAAAVGVSLKDGADIAKEVAGVVLVDGRLSDLAVARALSTAALDRVNRQFLFIMAVNSALIVLGLFGVVTPRFAAVCHNLGTVLVTAGSARPLLSDEPDAVIAMPLGENDAAFGEAIGGGRIGSA